MIRRFDPDRSDAAHEYRAHLAEVRRTEIREHNAALLDVLHGLDVITASNADHAAAEVHSRG